MYEYKVGHYTGFTTWVIWTCKRNPMGKLDPISRSYIDKDYLTLAEYYIQNTLIEVEPDEHAIERLFREPQANHYYEVFQAWDDRNYWPSNRLSFW